MMTSPKRVSLFLPPIYTLNPVSVVIETLVKSLAGGLASDVVAAGQYNWRLAQGCQLLSNQTLQAIHQSTNTNR